MVDNSLQAQTFLPNSNPSHHPLLVFLLSALWFSLGSQVPAPPRAQVQPVGNGNQLINATVSQSSGGPGWQAFYSSSGDSSRNQGPVPTAATLILAVSFIPDHAPLPFIPVSWHHLQIYHEGLSLQDCVMLCFQVNPN